MTQTNRLEEIEERLKVDCGKGIECDNHGDLFFLLSALAKMTEERDKLKAEASECCGAEMEERLEAAERRVLRLEGALKAIRDKWLYALRRDSMEGDKVLCHVGGVAHLLAVEIPEHLFPAASPSPSPETDSATKGTSGEGER